LAGPVAVGVVVVSKSFDWRILEGVTDSKKLSAAKRDVIYKRAVELQKEVKLDFAVGQVSASVIDAKGITTAIRMAMDRCIKRLAIDPKNTFVKLDG